MKRLLLIGLTLALAACATQEQSGKLDVEQAIRDYIEVRQLVELDQIRTGNTDQWSELDRKFIVYKTRRDVFLIEFSRNCYELNETPVVADVRHERDTIRAKFDTIRGCRMSRIFALTENDVAELESLSELQGSGTDIP